MEQHRVKGIDMVTKRYGYLIEEWHAARQEMRDILIRCARERRTITYGELAASIQAIQIAPHRYGMTGLLNEISALDNDEGLPILATLVVRKASGRPGGGYFSDLLADGMAENDLEAYWQAQFEQVCRAWQ